MWGITVTHAATFIASISRKSKRLVRVLPFTPFLGHPQLRNAGLGPIHIQDLYIYIYRILLVSTTSRGPASQLNQMAAMGLGSKTTPVSVGTFLSHTVKQHQLQKLQISATLMTRIPST